LTLQEFRQSHGRTGERYWQIWFEAPPGVAPEIVCSAWGAITNGKHKEHGRTSDRPGSKGKEGTKAYVDAAANAAFHHERLIRKKVEEGYVEVGLDGRPMVGGGAKEATIDHSLWLPKNLCFSKPRNKAKPQQMQNLDEDGQILCTRKVNGMMVIAHVKEDGFVELYSRRLETLTNHFPHLTRALGPLGMCFPPKSILLFEAFLGDGLNKNDLLKVQSVMRSKSQRAIELQQDKGWVKFYLFRTPIWKGVEIEKELTCEECCYAIENGLHEKLMDWRDEEIDGQFLFGIENFEGTVPEALLIAEENGWEGWVCYQKGAKLGDYSFGFHGKPDRPSCCWKLKPVQEDDFIAYWHPKAGTKKRPLGTYGSGKNSKRVGTLSLYQLDKDGNEVYICEVGSGLTDSQREKLVTADYPIVVQVLYDERSYLLEGDGSNALSLPRVAQIRTDKLPGECVNDQL